MWEIAVIHVGRLTEDGFRRGVERYASMMPSGWKLRLDSVPASKRQGVSARRAAETEALLARVPKDAEAVALDAEGERMNSEAFGRWLSGLKDRGRRVAFLVGGAHGFDPERITGLRRLSLSQMTLPHELATVLISEQIYRASCAYIGKAYAK
jgi:23S rRNA (pseudouridine1915-N3)-methyltransferase